MRSEKRRLSVVPLEEALAAPPALFGRSKIVRLDNTTKALRRTQKKLRTVFADSPGVATGDSGILHEKSGVVFAETRINDSGYVIGCLTPTPKKLRADLPLEVVTGICMFGGRAILGHTADTIYDLAYPGDLQHVQGVIGELTVDERLHVYEAEAVARLSAFIKSAWGQRDRAHTQVTFHLPVPEYIIYGLDLYSRGHMTAGALADYIAAVRRKGKQLEDMLRQCFRESSVSIAFNSPLSWIDAIDFFGLKPKEIPQLLYGLAAKQDKLWGKLINSSPGHQLLELNNLSYIYQYFQAAKRMQAGISQLAFVENPEELPIYWNAVKMQPDLGIAVDEAAVLYVHPRVVVKKAYPGRIHFLYHCFDGFNREAIDLAVNPQQ